MRIAATLTQTYAAVALSASREALHNLSRIAFESSQTVRQGDQAQRLPDWQVKLGNAAAASVRPNRLAAGALRALDRRQCSLPCNEHATLSLPCQSRAKHPARPRQVVQSFPKECMPAASDTRGAVYRRPHRTPPAKPLRQAGRPTPRDAFSRDNNSAHKKPALDRVRAVMPGPFRAERIF